MTITGLFRRGEFTLHSGDVSSWKIDMDALGYDDITTLAMMFAKVLPPFASVIGVPRGGLRLAGALYAYCTHETAHPILVVDDVYTTGRSMEKYREGMAGMVSPGQPQPIGAVVFSRAPHVPGWVTPLFTFTGERGNDGD